MDDLREHAIKLAKRLQFEADEFPPRSAGRNALLRAIRQIKAHYLWGEPQKKRLIIKAIEAGNRKIDEMERVTCLSRAEIEQLVAEMVIEKQILETREQPNGAGPGGRPFRFFRLP